MVEEQKYLVLEGMKAGVALKVKPDFLESLPYIFSHWPYEITTSPIEFFASIEWSDNRYRLSSPYMEKVDRYREPVNAICAIVAELAWQRLREDPSLLCLHGAAAEFSGRLVVFPATRRAGKSTLSVAMNAAGIRMFTDDFLPVSVSDNGVISGISSGVSPRLRLPVPDQIGENAKDYMRRRQTLSNKQYTYVSPLKTENACFNESAPVGGFVFLDRQDGALAELKEISKADALKTIIKQNFSRAGNAADILAMLEFLSNNLPSYLLRYDQAEPAIEILKQKFTGWDAKAPGYQPRAKLIDESAHGAKTYTVYKKVTEGRFEQAEGVKVVSTDGQKFLTGRNGQSIHYLNEGAAMIWQILSEPASAAEAVEILHAAFPEQEVAQLERDVKACFKDFARNGLLKKTDSVESSEMVAE